METGGQGEAAGVEEAGGEGQAAGWRRLVQGEAARLEEAEDGELEMVRWRSRAKKSLHLKSIYRTSISLIEVLKVPN